MSNSQPIAHNCHPNNHHHNNPPNTSQTPNQSSANYGYNHTFAAKHDKDSPRNYHDYGQSKMNSSQSYAAAAKVVPGSMKRHLQPSPQNRPPSSPCPDPTPALLSPSHFEHNNNSQKQNYAPQRPQCYNNNHAQSSNLIDLNQQPIQQQQQPPLNLHISLEDIFSFNKVLFHLRNITPVPIFCYGFLPDAIAYLANSTREK